MKVKVERKQLHVPLHQVELIGQSMPCQLMSAHSLSISNIHSDSHIPLLSIHDLIAMGHI